MHGNLAPVLRSAVATLLLAAPASAATTVTRLGAEFQANSTTFLFQSEPSVATFADGRFIAAWTDESGAAPDMAGKAVRARRFAHSGAPIGADFVVNTTKAGDQKQPGVARLSGGTVALAWADNSGAGADKSGFAIRGQRLAGFGQRLGGEFQLNAVAASDQDAPAIAALTTGGFAAAWESGPGAGNVRGQAFNAAAGRLGTEFRADAGSAAAARQPAIAGLDAGRFVVAWTDLVLSGGRGSLDILAQRYASQGARVGGPLIVNTIRNDVQERPAVASLGGGSFVVVWADDSETGADQDGSAVRGQIVAASGQKAGAEFLVPTRRTGDQSEPAVASFPNGRFVVVWTDASRGADDPSGTAIRAQLYSRAGQKLGAEFRVNQRTVGEQSQPAAATFDNTDFVVVWTDLSFGQPPDPSATGVRGQVFRASP